MKKLIPYIFFICLAYLCFIVVMCQANKEVKTNYKVIANDRGIITTYDTIRVTKQQIMITDTMNFDEVLKELSKYDNILNRRCIGWEKKYNKILRKLKINNNKVVACQKIDTNTYFILNLCKDKISYSFDLIYIYLRKNKWYALSTGEVNSLYGVRLDVYEPHLFERYKQRFGVDKTGVELIYDYFQNNANIYKRHRTYTYNDKEYKITNIKDGIAIIEKEITPKGAIWFYKTCLSDNLLKESQLSFKELIDEDINIMKELDSIWMTQKIRQQIIQYWH